MTRKVVVTRNSVYLVKSDKDEAYVCGHATFSLWHVVPMDRVGKVVGDIRPGRPLTFTDGVNGVRTSTVLSVLEVPVEV